MQDTSRLRESLPHALVRAFRLVNRAHNRACKELGVSAEQAHVLLLLWELGAMPMGRLQRLLALSSPTLTGAIDRMEGQGLVRRVPSPADGRAWLLEPTPAATRKRTKLEDAIAKIDAASFAGLSAAERRELHRLLDKTAAALEA